RSGQLIGPRRCRGVRGPGGAAESIPPPKRFGPVPRLNVGDTPRATDAVQGTRARRSAGVRGRVRPVTAGDLRSPALSGRALVARPATGPARPDADRVRGRGGEHLYRLRRASG